MRTERTDLYDSDYSHLKFSGYEETRNAEQLQLWLLHIDLCGEVSV